MVFVLHTIIYLTFVTGRVKDRPVSGSCIYMGFIAVKNRTK